MILRSQVLDSLGWYRPQSNRNTFGSKKRPRCKEEGPEFFENLTTQKQPYKVGPSDVPQGSSFYHHRLSPKALTLWIKLISIESKS
jgi:hypothetical protein